MSGYHEKSFSINEIDIAQEERKVSNLLQDPSDPEISGHPDLMIDDDNIGSKDELIPVIETA